MTADQIRNAVISYVRDENANYAVLINGTWGSGKTYLYENYLVEAIDSIEVGKSERRFNIYISLYGMSNIDSLAKQLYTSYLIHVKSNGNEIVEKGLEVVTGFTSVISRAFSFSIGPVKTDINDIFSEISKFSHVKDMVICFDDLERCSIPINELFGFINNLIEHCNCKVLILADEANIGKIYANTNVEEKYLSVLTGNRRVVQYRGSGNNTNQEKVGLGKDPNGEITVEELKKLNEALYSENYLYRDIKEKVIGKTMLYYPDLKDIIGELINGKEPGKGIISEGAYKTYLEENMKVIVNSFKETENRNLRIVKMWLLVFKKIYDTTTKLYENDRYYNDILSEFLRYSIWVAGALRKNKKIIPRANSGVQQYVSFEGNDFRYILKYDFIDAWIRRDVWSEAELSRACKSIIERKEREAVNNPSGIKSTGEKLEELRSWYLMDDEKVRGVLNDLVKEIEDNKYAYCDYSEILVYLLQLKENGLYTGDLESIRKILIDLIQKDNEVQEDNSFPKSLPDEKIDRMYNELYTSLSEERKRRNRALGKIEQADADIYRNAEAFLENCRKMESYYCKNRSFVEYIDLTKLIGLINRCDNEGIYTIEKAFFTVYYMGNLADFYMADIEGLKLLRSNITDEEVVKQGGITRKIALGQLVETINRKLTLLGVDESQM